MVQVGSSVVLVHVGAGRGSVVQVEDQWGR